MDSLPKEILRYELHKWLDIPSRIMFSRVSKALKIGKVRSLDSRLVFSYKIDFIKWFYDQDYKLKYTYYPHHDLFILELAHINQSISLHDGKSSIIKMVKAGFMDGLKFMYKNYEEFFTGCAKMTTIKNIHCYFWPEAVEWARETFDVDKGFIEMAYSGAARSGSVQIFQNVETSYTLPDFLIRPRSLERFVKDILKSCIMGESIKNPVSSVDSILNLIRYITTNYFWPDNISSLYLSLFRGRTIILQYFYDHYQFTFGSITEVLPYANLECLKWVFKTFPIQFSQFNSDKLVAKAVKNCDLEMIKFLNISSPGNLNLRVVYDNITFDKCVEILKFLVTKYPPPNNTDIYKMIERALTFYQDKLLSYLLSIKEPNDLDFREKRIAFFPIDSNLFETCLNSQFKNGLDNRVTYTRFINCIKILLKYECPIPPKIIIPSILTPNKQIKLINLLEKKALVLRS